MSKVRFFCGKHRDSGIFKGTFIVSTPEDARELALTSGVMTEEDVGEYDFVDTSLKMTEVDKLHKSTIRDGATDEDL